MSTDSIRGWLPGPRQSQLRLKLDKAIRPGRYELAIGVVDPISEKPAVRLAIAGRDAAGWYPISRPEIATDGPN